MARMTYYLTGFSQQISQIASANTASLHFTDEEIEAQKSNLLQVQVRQLVSNETNLINEVAFINLNQSTNLSQGV